MIDIGAGPGGLAQRAGREGLHGHRRRPVPARPRCPRGTEVVRPETSTRPAGASTCRAYDVPPAARRHRAPAGPGALPRPRSARQFDYRPRTLVLTTPNVAFVVQRLMLLVGQFNYGKAGILDRTHTRLLHLPQPRTGSCATPGFRIQRDPRRPGAVPQGAGRERRSARALLAAQPGAHPAEPDAVLLPDLRRGRDHARRRLRPRRQPTLGRAGRARTTQDGRGRAEEEDLQAYPPEEATVTASPPPAVEVPGTTGNATRAFLLALAAVFLGQALQINNGNGHPGRLAVRVLPRCSCSASRRSPRPGRRWSGPETSSRSWSSAWAWRFSSPSSW